MRIKLTLAILILCFFLPFVVRAQDGSLDSTFGLNGRAYNPVVLNQSVNFEAIDKQAGGKIIVAGSLMSWTTSLWDTNIMICRYTPLGVLDSSFGVNGLFTLMDTTASSHTIGIKVLSNDKILIGANRSVGGINSFEILKLNANGSIDSTFGTNGKSLISSSNRSLRGLFLQSNGKIILQSDSFLYRLTPQGGIDLSFGTFGSLNVGDKARFLIQRDDKIVGFKGTEAIAIRYLPNGIIDTMFGRRGHYVDSVWLLTTNWTNHRVLDVLLDSMDRIIYVYISTSNTSSPTRPSWFTFRRFTQAGIKDTSWGRSFNGSGCNDHNLGQDTKMRKVLLQKNQKILIAEFESVGGVSFGGRRYYQEPCLGMDTSYGGKGYSNVKIPWGLYIVNYGGLMLNDTSWLSFGTLSSSPVLFKFKTSQYNYQPGPPQAQLGVNRVVGSVNSDLFQLSDLSGNYPTQWQWSISPSTVNFMNGTSNTSKNPVVSFQQPGLYTVKLKVSNVWGADSVERFQLIDVWYKPVARFSVTSNVSDTNMIIGLLDSSLNAPSQWKWIISASTVTYEQGSSDTSQHPKVRFKEPGFYTIKLIASSRFGVDTFERSNFVTVVNGFSPIADFTSNRQIVAVDSLVYFEDKSLFSPASRVWHLTPNSVLYENGTDSSSSQPIIRFKAPGKYEVGLKVTNSLGSDSMVKVDYIDVGLAPVARFSSNTTREVVHNSVWFMDSSLHQPTTWRWDIYPQTFTYIQSSPASPSPQVQFDSACQYRVSLHVANQYGADSITVINYIEVLWLGLNEQLSGSNICVYPNPVERELYLNSLINGKGGVVKLFNLQGKQVKEFILEDGQHKLAVDDLSMGLYIGVLELMNQKFMFKFLKQ